MTEVAVHANGLDPLRTALIARAGADAAQLRRAAEADGRQVVATARKQADALLAQARAQGEADAAGLLAVERARARRAARAVVLDAQHVVYDDLRKQARAAVRRLLDDPAKRTRLAAVVRGQLGEGAEIRAQPDGGLVGETPDGRSVNATVEALVERAVADLDLEQLWTP